MKTATFDQLHSGSASTGSTPVNAVWGAFKQFLEGMRQARADYDLRAELASLDDAVLRDIGIAEDEISRVIAREDFTPRAWA